MNHWIIGMDVSSLPEVERCGGRFYDQGRQGDLLEILQGYGTNLVRIRLWNDPYDEQGNPYGAGTNDLPSVIALARRVRKLGMDWLLDFHYSDFWADPGKQRLPKAWRGLSLEQLVQAVYDYTAQVLDTLASEGVPPQMVAVGNEASNGILWPMGQVPHYDNLARLVSAGVRAVREHAPQAQVMLHLDNGGNNELYRRWFDQYLANGGEDFDCIGLSYYPFWHGTPEMLRENMNDIALRYNKPLIVAEISTGHTLEDYQDYEQLPDDQRKGMASKPELAAKVPYPMTPQGQADFMEDIMTLIRQVPNGLGRGIIYWEPGWLPVPGSQWANGCALPYLEEAGPGGNEWANQALFDYDGNALPALERIRGFQEGDAPAPVG